MRPGTVRLVTVLNTNSLFFRKRPLLIKNTFPTSTRSELLKKNLQKSIVIYKKLLQKKADSKHDSNGNGSGKSKSIWQEPTFYTALGMLGGVISYTYSEHLRRKQILINTANGILNDLKKCYEEASKITFKTELKISEAAKDKNVQRAGFTKKEKLGFARFAELQYRVMLASDTRMTNPKLRVALEDNFNSFINLLFSPDFDADPQLQKKCIGYFFIIHQLIIGYEKSLSEFMTNVTKTYISETQSFEKLYAQQEDFILESQKKAKTEIFNKEPTYVLLNITKIFRQNHFDRNPDNPVYSPKLS